MVSLLAGKPNAATFPFSSISVAIKPVIPGDPVETLVIESDALQEGLQYGPTAGLKGLVGWLEELQVSRHKRVKDGSWRTSVGNGSQDLINKVSARRLIDWELWRMLSRMGPLTALVTRTRRSKR
jgi:tryptophan aminotransferase